MDIVTYDLPAHWAPMLLNDDDDGLSTEDIIAMVNFFKEEPELLYCLSCSDGEGDFRRYHDATPHGVLPCNVLTYSFTTTPPDPQREN